MQRRAIRDLFRPSAGANRRSPRRPTRWDSSSSAGRRTPRADPCRQGRPVDGRPSPARIQRPSCARSPRRRRRPRPSPRSASLVERQMCTPCLVDDQRLAAVMTHRGDLFEVGARAVRTRADDQRARRVGVAIPCRATSSGDGGWEMCRSASHRGVTHRVARRRRSGLPRSTCGCRGRRSSPPSAPPATAIMAALTESELPHVEKNAASAPTASAIRSSARCRNLPRVRRSSSPPLASRSSSNGWRPSTDEHTVVGTPRPADEPAG